MCSSWEAQSLLAASLPFSCYRRMVFSPSSVLFVAKRERAEVRATLQKYELLKGLEVIFTNQRTGSRSKGAICVSEKMLALFDDCADILQDTLEKGIKIYPIKAEYQQHWWWCKLGGTAFDSLKLAVDVFIKDQATLPALKNK